MFVMKIFFTLDIQFLLMFLLCDVLNFERRIRSFIVTSIERIDFVYFYFVSLLTKLFIHNYSTNSHIFV